MIPPAMQGSLTITCSAFSVGKAFPSPARQINPCVRHSRRGASVLNAFVPLPSNAGSVSEVTSHLRSLLSDVSGVVDKPIHPVGAAEGSSAVYEFISGNCIFRVQRDGRFVATREVDPAGYEGSVASGKFTLPEACRGDACQVSFQQHRGATAESDSAEVAWNVDGFCLARLRIRKGTPASEKRSWCKGLKEGFLLEFKVRMACLEMAELCVDLAPAGHWFGGGHLMRQLWPLERASLEVGPYYPFDNGPNGLNTLVGTQWISSKGLLVMADPDTAFMHVGINAPKGQQGKRRSFGVGVQNMSKENLPRSSSAGEGDGLLRLQARASYESPVVSHPLGDWLPRLRDLAENPFRDSQAGDMAEEWATLRTALCMTDNAKEAALAGLASLQAPGRSPSKEVLTSPIWTTWARYFSRVTQAKVLKFASEITSRSLPRSVMEIDDRWQTKYGDLEFDPVKFPDPKGMVAQLHAMGFKVTCWVMPFFEEASTAYQEGAKHDFFIKSQVAKRGWWKSLKPGFFNWWNSPPVVALDVTNPKAVAWFVHRLRKLQEETGIDGFKFDAGEPCFLPPQFETYVAIPHPTEYTQRYVRDLAGQFAGGVSEVRTGHKTQGIALLTRMGDRFSTWGEYNGLRSIIPTLLTSGLLGYPFTLPDMIGGNAYFGQRPDTELMVRWTQVNLLMPAMQFSIAPWDLSPEAERLCKATLAQRAQLSGRMHTLAEEAAQKLTPIARPLWWLDPADEATFRVNDQFALGDDIVVAPVVEKGARSRNLYLPRGRWRDLFKPGDVIQGPVLLSDYPAPLDTLPVFEKLSEAAQQPVRGTVASVLS